MILTAYILTTVDLKNVIAMNRPQPHFQSLFFSLHYNAYENITTT